MGAADPASSPYAERRNFFTTTLSHSSLPLHQHNNVPSRILAKQIIFYTENTSMVSLPCDNAGVHWNYLNECTSSTSSTLIWFLTSVGVLVSVVITWLCKLFFTALTLVWLLSSVDKQMSFVVTSTTKTLHTLVTAVGLLSSVDAQVSLEITLETKTLSTLFTAVWFLSSVDSQVCLVVT